MQSPAWFSVSRTAVSGQPLRGKITVQSAHPVVCLCWRIELEIRTDAATPTTNAKPLRALLYSPRRYPLEKGPGPMTSALVILYLVMFSLYWLWTGAPPRPCSARAVPAKHLPGHSSDP
jgi:hypothetical protein